MSRRSRPRAARPVTAFLAAALLSAGCSSSMGAALDVGALEDDITATLAPAYEAEGMTWFDTTCPTRDWQTGDVFACTAEVERQFVRVRVEIVGPGAWDWTTLDIVHRLERTEDLVAQEMSASLGDTITLACGSPRIRVLPIGSSFRCEATDSAGNGVPTLLTVNGSGQTGWEVLR